MTEKQLAVRDAEICCEEARAALNLALLDLKHGTNQASAKMLRTVSGLELDVTLAQTQLRREEANFAAAKYAMENYTS